MYGIEFEQRVAEQLYRGATLEAYPLETPADHLSIKVPTPCLLQRFTETLIERNDKGQSCLYVPAHRVSTYSPPPPLQHRSFFASIRVRYAQARPPIHLGQGYS